MATKDQSEGILDYPSIKEKKDYSERDDASFLEYVRQYLIEVEDNIDHLYLDTEKNVTIGIGHLVTKNKVSSLEFVYKIPPTSPLPEKPGETEKQVEYQRVVDLLKTMNEVIAKNKNKFPSAKHEIFVKATHLKMDESEINKLFNEDLNIRLNEIRKIFKRFDKFPDPAKLGIIDLYYNVRHFSAYVDFKNCVLKEDWECAGAESARNNPGLERRNARAKQLFEEAIKIKAMMDGTKDKNQTPSEKQNILAAEKGYDDVWQS